MAKAASATRVRRVRSRREPIERVDATIRFPSGRVRRGRVSISAPWPLDTGPVADINLRGRVDKNPVADNAAFDAQLRDLTQVLHRELTHFLGQGWRGRIDRGEHAVAVSFANAKLIRLDVIGTSGRVLRWEAYSGK